VQAEEILWVWTSVLQ